MSAAGGTGPVPGGTPTTRERPADLRSAELVSRLLAATPPYLYNMPIVPHSYFFSEMLRSFVHAKNNNDANRTPPGQPPPPPPPSHRRSRKRSWNQSKISPTLDTSNIHPKEWQQPWQIRSCDDTLYDNNNKNQPLELTTNKNSVLSKHEEKHQQQQHQHQQQLDETKIRKSSPKLLDATNHMKDEKFPEMLTVPPALSLPPPPPPPLWYPPLYPPPYGIDPLNFFIDLRVSGHIYDRKHGTKDASDPQPETNQQTPLIFENGNTSAFKENVKSNRHVSAFSVPKPRENKQHFPINLCHGGKFNMKYYDDDQKTKTKNPTSAHYVMQNLKRIYGDLSSRCEEDEVQEDKADVEPSEQQDNEDSDSSESKRKKRCKDLRALIGLELVVDYVKGRNNNNNGKGETDDVEVLEDQ